MGALAKVGIRGRVLCGQIEAGLKRLCVSAGNGWSLGARGGAGQAWLSRDAGEAWGVIAVVLSKKITIICFSSCLGRWQRGAGADAEEREVGQLCPSEGWRSVSSGGTGHREWTT